MRTAIETRDATDSVPDRGNVLTGLCWGLTAVALIAAGLRIVTRARSRRFGWDDMFMLLSMGCFIAWSAVLTIYCQHGGEQHLADLVKKGLDNLALVLFLNWLAQVFGIIGVAAGKISVSALLLGIIKGTALRWQKLYLWTVTIGLASLVAVSCSILTFAQCSPAAALWDERVKGDCINPHVMSSYGILTGSFNTFADASLAIIPATIFWRMNTSRNEKTQLTIIFGLNILTSICSGLKTQYLAELANRTDQTWATYNIFAWVTAELCLMIVCGTVPTLYPVFRWARSLFGLHSTASRSSAAAPKASNTPSNKETELSSLDYKHARTRTAVERGSIPQSESLDQLVGEPNPVVRIDKTYDVKHGVRPPTSASSTS